MEEKAVELDKTYGVNRREALQAQGPLPEPRAKAAEAYMATHRQWQEAEYAFKEKYKCDDTI